MRGFGPVALTVGALKAFRGSETGRDYDVIYAEVDSPDLHRLHALMKSLPHTEKFSTYKPHATICYVRAGLADKYLALLEPVNEALTVSALTVCSAAREHTSVPLTEGAVAKSLPSLLAALADARGPDFAAAVLADARELAPEAFAP